MDTFHCYGACLCSLHLHGNHIDEGTVYGGVKSFYKEDDKTTPVNVYGKSKVAAESYVISNYSNYAILRSSIIYGPQPFVPVPKTLPLQVSPTFKVMCNKKCFTRVFELSVRATSVLTEHCW